MVRRAEVSEAEVAVAAERWLVSNGYEVYREVRTGYGETRADLIGLRGRATHVVECKTRLSFDLIEQAFAWLGRSEQVSVCVPQRAHRDRLPTVVLRTLGVGLLEGESLAYPEFTCARQVVPSRFLRVKDDPFKQHVRHSLHEGQKRLGVAGTKQGGYFTEFRYTMEKVAAFVAAHPGATIREAADGIEHHYASDRGARQGLWKAIMGGLCPEVRCDYKADPFRLYPTEPEGAKAESAQAGEPRAGRGGA